MIVEGIRKWNLGDASLPILALGFQANLLLIYCLEQTTQTWWPTITIYNYLS